MPAGRYAPSPSGPLHVGNLRTALVAWWAARGDGCDFAMRVEDLDPSSRAEHEEGQLADLRAIGIDWDGAVLRQSEHRDRYQQAIQRLIDSDLTYSCFCTRREIREAGRAPHAAPDAYPGTCRELSRREIAIRVAAGRPPALRLRSDHREVEVIDGVHGPTRGIVDDVVLRRNDGLPAYNLTVVVDDHYQAVGEVMRGDDLLSSTPRQVHLARLLGLTVPSYLHVPLVLGADGNRLAKRHGSVTLEALTAQGHSVDQVRRLLLASLGLDPVSPGDRPPPLDRSALSTRPWAFDPRHLDPPSPPEPCQ